MMLILKIVSNKNLLFLILSCFLTKIGHSQRYLTDFDSSFFVKDTLRPILKRFENIRVSGYLQPQFQVAQSQGARSFNGGDFQEFSQSRFMLRRARVRIDYFLPSKDGYPKALFTFQIDATERGVGLRDMFVKLYERRKHDFSLTMGMFARPFGFEVNLSSSFREAPERGRMSQILMPSERDLGIMISYEPIKADAKLKFLKLDLGYFNGQGLSGPAEFDNYKDVNSRLAIKPISFREFSFSGGISTFFGGWRQSTKYVYEIGLNSTGEKDFLVDSSAQNIGRKAPRHYYGADGQIKFRHGWGETELRAEYWFGKQPGTINTTANPGQLPLSPTYIRNFDGVFLLLLQNIINKRNQLIIKYDWYDPNRDVRGREIGKAGTNLTAADIKYNTLGVGFLRHLNEVLKVTFYYDIVNNELSPLSGYSKDLRDNIFTCRIQYRF